MSAPPLPAGLVAADWSLLTQGTFGPVHAATLDDGRRVVVKRTPCAAAYEAEGLRALHDAGAPVPAVVAADGHVLCVELVAAAPPSEDDWARLGARLAAVHRDAGPGRFGWHRDNCIGRLPQPNAAGQFTDRTSPALGWPQFFAEHRLRPHLDADALPASLRRRLERALAGPLPELLDHRPAPSLCHGDLWSGNVLGGRYLIDPAIAYVDRELELAFMTLFGGFPPALFAGYADAWPLPPGWEPRRPALQLYHLLVHVAHFGSGYVRPVADRLDALGW